MFRRHAAIHRPSSTCTKTKRDQLCRYLHMPKNSRKNDVPPTAPPMTGMPLETAKPCAETAARAKRRRDRSLFILPVDYAGRSEHERKLMVELTRHLFAALIGTNRERNGNTWSTWLLHFFFKSYRQDEVAPFSSRYRGCRRLCRCSHRCVCSPRARSIGHGTSIW